MTPEQAKARLRQIEIEAQAAELDLSTSATVMDAATGLPMAMRPPGADYPTEGTPTVDRFGDTIRATTEAPRAMTGAYLRGLADPSQSVSRNALPEWLPDPIRSGAAYLNDAAGTVLGAGLTAASGAVGLVAETAGGSPTGEKQLARDIFTMGDALAGAPGTSTVSRPFVNIADDAAARVPAATKIPPAATTVAGAGDDADRVGRLVARASAGNERAITELAQLARVNKKARDAATRLGIDLPPDVFSDNPMVQAAAGLTRSEPASASEAAWVGAIRAASDQADNVIANLGGSKDVSSISDDVFTALTSKQTGLESRAGKLYDAVDELIKRPTSVGTPRLNSTLTEIIQEVGEDGLTAAERALLKAATREGGITYGRLIREKQAIGRAIDRGDGPYGDVQVAALKRMYAALADDQMTAARVVAGDDAAGMLELANRITKQQKDLEGTIVSVFGKDLDGSIARRLETAVNSASKGDVAALARIMNVVPKELRGEAVLTAVMSATKSRSAAGALPQGAFGFAEYAKFYKSLRQNKVAYNLVRKNLAPEVQRALNDLYLVSDRITTARRNVITTGRANKVLLHGMTADNFAARVLETSLGRRATEAAGYVAGGPVGVVGARATAKMLTEAQRKTVAAAGALFRDPKFVRAVLQNADDTQAAADAIAKLPTFQRWYKAAENAGVSVGSGPTSSTVIRMFAIQDGPGNDNRQPWVMNVR